MTARRKEPQMKKMKRFTLGLMVLCALVALVATQGDVSGASLTSRAQIQISGNLTNVAGLQTATAPLSVTKTLDLANGVAVNQANVLFSNTYAITTGATQSLDLAGGGLTDAFGVALAPARVKCVVITASSSNTTNLTILGSANAVPILNTAATTMTLTPGGIFLACNPSATGWAVTAGTGDIVQIVNAAGATANADVVLIGASS